MGDGSPAGVAGHLYHGSEETDETGKQHEKIRALPIPMRSGKAEFSL
jgi:hypothetical protein